MVFTQISGDACEESWRNVEICVRIQPYSKRAILHVQSAKISFSLKFPPTVRQNVNLYSFFFAIFEKEKGKRDSFSIESFSKFVEGNILSYVARTKYIRSSVLE